MSSRRFLIYISEIAGFAGPLLKYKLTDLLLKF